MFEHIKLRIIKSLIEEIGGINDVYLELVGHNLISVIEGHKLI